MRRWQRRLADQLFGVTGQQCRQCPIRRENNKKKNPKMCFVLLLCKQGQLQEGVVGGHFTANKRNRCPSLTRGLREQVAGPLPHSESCANDVPRQFTFPTSVQERLKHSPIRYVTLLLLHTMSTLVHWDGMQGRPGQNGHVGAKWLSALLANLQCFFIMSYDFLKSSLCLKQWYFCHLKTKPSYEINKLLYYFPSMQTDLDLSSR